MKGTDCTPEQLAAAERFVLNGVRMADVPERFVMKRVDLVRLIAWYGAIRFRAAKAGIGSEEKPGLVGVLEQ